MEHDVPDYTYPIAAENEEIQWDLLAKNGVITQEEAERHKASDNARPAVIARRPATRIIKGMRRLNRLYEKVAEQKRYDRYIAYLDAQVTMLRQNRTTTPHQGPHLPDKKDATCRHHLHGDV